MFFVPGLRTAVDRIGFSLISMSVGRFVCKTALFSLLTIRFICFFPSCPISMLIILCSGRVVTAECVERIIRPGVSSRIVPFSSSAFFFYESLCSSVLNLRNARSNFWRKALWERSHSCSAGMFFNCYPSLLCVKYQKNLWIPHNKIVTWSL